jgi:hypothetical protein
VWLRRPWLGVRAAVDPTETYAELHDLVFAWSTPQWDSRVNQLYQLGFQVSPSSNENA